MIKNKILIILLIVGFLLPSFASLETDSTEPIVPLPGTLDEAKTLGKKALDFFPATLKSIWQEALGIWQKIYNFAKKIWNSYLWSKISPIFEQFKKDLEKRKTIIKEELPKEKEEIKKEVPEVGKSLWEKFKELIR